MSKAKEFCERYVEVLKSRPIFKYDGGPSEFEPNKRDIFQVAHVTDSGHLQLREIIVEPEIALELAAWLIENFSESGEIQDVPTNSKRSSSASKPKSKPSGKKSRANSANSGRTKGV